MTSDSSVSVRNSVKHLPSPPQTFLKIFFKTGSDAVPIMDSSVSTHTSKHLYSPRSFDVSVYSLANNNTEEAEEECEVLEEVLATLPISSAERERVREQYRVLEELGKKPFFLAG
jgi:hypothetical protein